jgi:outer membrane receptor protein involved in Fe transport
MVNVSPSVGTGTQIFQPHNGGDGKVYGFEVAARLKFLSLPSPLDGLGVSGNLTRQWTSVDLGPAVQGKQRIQNAPNLLSNVEVFFEKHGLSLDLVYNHTGSYVSIYDTLGVGQGWDNVWVRPNSRLDLHAGYRYRNYKLDLSVSNLLKTETYWSHITKDNLAVSDIVNSGSTALATLTVSF